MATNYPQYFLTSAIGVDGDKTIPPASADQAGTGRLSQSAGFGSANSLPIEQGGIPPYRDDFNGALYLISQLLLWYQQGGVMNYSAAIDYEVGNEVFSGTVKYRCIQPNGPGSAVKSPNDSPDYWADLDSIGYVRYDVAQSLTTAQQAQARTNINVWNPTETNSAIATAISGLVSFAVSQSLTATQQKTARDNIGVLSAQETQSAINSAVGSVNSSVFRPIGIGQTFTTPAKGTHLSILVFCSLQHSLTNNNPSRIYNILVNGSVIGSVTLVWGSMRTGGKGFGYYAAIEQSQYFTVARNINPNDRIGVQFVSMNDPNGGYSASFVKYEYCLIIVSD